MSAGDEYVLNITKILQGTPTNFLGQLNLFLLNITKILQGTPTNTWSTSLWTSLNITKILQGTPTYRNKKVVIDS